MTHPVPATLTFTVTDDDTAAALKDALGQFGKQFA